MSQNNRIQGFFLLFLHEDRRIRQAKKHVDPAHWGGGGVGESHCRRGDGHCGTIGVSCICTLWVGGCNRLLPKEIRSRQWLISE
jgi:hypothetical protein